MNRQHKIFLGLVILLLLAVGYAWYRMPTQQYVSDVANRNVSHANGRQQASSSAADTDRLLVELLQRPAQRFLPPGRDLFNFVAPAQPKVKKEPPKVKVEPTPVKIAPPPPVETPVQTTTRRALARFTFLGYLLKDQRRTVFLSRGEDLFLVREGENFGDNDEFHAVSITPEKMQIRQENVTGLIEIMLIDKQPLVPNFSNSRNVAPHVATPVGNSEVHTPVVPSRPASRRPFGSSGSSRPQSGSPGQ